MWSDSMKNLNPELHVLLGAALLVCAVLSACSSDTTVVKVQGSTTISKGQELTDLQRAKDEGILSQEEYDSVRAKILKRPN
jgi:hypothetical protein